MDAYQDVRDFHRKFGHPVGETPAVPDDGTVRLRQRLVQEEFLELMAAMQKGDLPGIADGALDLVYVVLGTLLAYGVDPTPLWAAIHRANLSKGQEKRADGKVLKGDGFVPPDVEGLLRCQGWEVPRAGHL